MKIKLSVLPSSLTQPILDGRVDIPGIAIEAMAANSVDRNSRQMLSLAFDAAEMSFATYVKAREDGIPIIGVPVFTGRRFLHEGIAVSSRSGIGDLTGLRGKKVGVPQYWMTSSVWYRELLQSEYGVRPEEVQWFTFAPERLSSLQFPAGVSVTQMEGDLEHAVHLLAAGQLDAWLAPKPVSQVVEGVRMPFEDVGQTQQAYYRKTGIVPIMHFIVMREELERESPGLAGRIMQAFRQAKTLAEPGGSGDAYPYGLGPNRLVLSRFLETAWQQGLVSRLFPLDELFAGRDEPC